jgi:hypothetical protein
MEIAFFEGFPLVAVEPDAFAAMTVIDGEGKAASHQILDHAKAAFRAINRQARFSQF